MVSSNARECSRQQKILIMCTYGYRKIVYQITVSCCLVYEFLRCSLPAGTIDVDLKVRILKGIHVYKRFEVPTNCSPWGAEGRSYKDFKMKIIKYLKREKWPSKNYEGRPLHPKVHLKRRILVTLSIKHGVLRKNVKSQLQKNLP